MRKKQGNTIQNFDTGKLLRKSVKEKELSYTRLAKLMRRTPNTVKSLIENTSVQAYILWEFCYALNYNYFADFAGWLPPTMPSGSKLHQRITELEKQNSELQLQVKTLEKAIELMGRK